MLASFLDVTTHGNISFRIGFVIPVMFTPSLLIGCMMIPHYSTGIIRMLKFDWLRLLSPPGVFFSFCQRQMIPAGYSSFVKHGATLFDGSSGIVLSYVIGNLTKIRSLSSPRTHPVVFFFSGGSLDLAASFSSRPQNESNANANFPAAWMVFTQNHCSAWGLAWC